MEMQSDGVTLLVLAGVGWEPGVVGVTTVKAEVGSSEGHALKTGEPVVSNDISLEDRFLYAEFIKDHGVKSLVNVPVISRTGEPFGILQIDSRSTSKFGEQEVGFLRTYANLLSAAVDRIKTTDELRATRAALKERELALIQSSKLEAIGQLTGGVAHDFNNLLTIIRSSIEFLKRDNLSEQRRARYVEAISETVDRAAKMTGQLLAFARRQSLNPEVFDVGERLRTAVDLLRPLLGSRITIAMELCDPACFARADASQFETALLNLSVNARDAMDGEGPLRFKVESVSSLPAVRGQMAASGEFIAVSVIDAGRGIEADQIDGIFEPFFTTKAVGKGTGLGLSQVIGFAKQSGGEIAVHSIPEKGSTFTIYLPRSEEAEEPFQPPSGDVARFAPEVDACILVVEDNEAVGNFSTEMLHDLGYRTVWAANAGECLRLLTEDRQRFDLVFSDVVMPGMNGIEMAEILRERYPNLPVVITSGYSNVIAQEGSHGFRLIQKPYSIEDVAVIMRDLIALPRPK